MLCLVMVAALTLLDWEGGHQGQVLGKGLLLEPACCNVQSIDKVDT